MEQIVITYIHDEYDDPYYEDVACVEYESIQAFLVHLEEKVEVYLKKKRIAKELQLKWEENYPKQVSFNHKTQWIEAINKFVKESPSPRWDWNDKIEINGLKFDAEDFIEDYKIKFPKIQTLEEWFQEKLKQN